MHMYIYTVVGVSPRKAETGVPEQHDRLLGEAALSTPG